MTYIRIILLSAFALVLGGCSSHLLFVEESHIGLKAKIAASQTSPYNLDLGYRRGMVALIPLQSAEGERGTNPDEGENPTGSERKEIVIVHDPNDLMSLYCVFKANIGFNDPVEIYHFLATGRAAITLLAKEEELRKIIELKFSKDMK